MTNAPVTIGFAAITTAQLAVGILMVVFSRKGGKIRRSVCRNRFGEMFITFYVAITLTQPRRTYTYPSTHTIYACSSVIDP